MHVFLLNQLTLGWILINVKPMKEIFPMPYTTFLRIKFYLYKKKYNKKKIKLKILITSVKSTTKKNQAFKSLESLLIPPVSSLPKTWLWSPSLPQSSWPPPTTSSRTSWPPLPASWHPGCLPQASGRQSPTHHSPPLYSQLPAPHFSHCDSSYASFSSPWLPRSNSGHSEHLTTMTSKSAHMLTHPSPAQN